MAVMKLFKVPPHNATLGELGVEIEAEGYHLPQYNIPSWHREHDGSLNNGVEYVLRQPMKLMGVRVAILELSAAVKKSRARVDSTIRTGVHVHVNMQKATKAQLFNMIVMWAIFEEVLLDRCGIGRKGNLFCLPLRKADNVISIMRMVAEDSAYADSMDNDQYRYCAVNVVSLHKFGSLEFRALRTSADMNVTYHWAKLLLNMKKVACAYKNPMHILDELDRDGVYAMYRKVFHKSLDFLGTQVGLVRKVNKGMMTANTIAYASDWVAETEEPVVWEPREKLNEPRKMNKGLRAGRAFFAPNIHNEEEEPQRLDELDFDFLEGLDDD